MVMPVRPPLATPPVGWAGRGTGAGPVGLGPVAPRRVRNRTGARHTAGVVTALAALVALLAAACGAPPATQTPTPASSTPRPSPLAPGSFTVTLPAGWRSVGLTGSTAAVVNSISAENVIVGQSLAAQLAHVSTRTVYYAFDASPATVGSGTLVSLNIVRIALPAGVNLTAFSKGVRSQIESLVEGTVQPTTILTTSGPADRYVYQAPFTDANGQDRVAPVTQYVVVAPGYGYELTFATTAARISVDAPIFDAIAQSFTAAMP